MNILLLGLLGLYVSIWIARHTDWADVLLPVLAFGGVLSWLSFLGSLIPDRWTGLIKHEAFKRLFASRLATAVISSLGLLAILGTFIVATVEIESVQDAVPREVRIYPKGSISPVEGDILKPGGRLRSIHLVGFGSRRFTVNVDRFPAITRELTPYSIDTLYLPSSFFPPAILVRCQPSLIWRLRSVENPGETLLVWSGPTPGELTLDAIYPHFRGRSIWVGCDASVEIPPVVRQRWRDELAYEKDHQKEAIVDWFNPIGMVGSAVHQLKPGEWLRIEHIDGANLPRIGDRLFVRKWPGIEFQVIEPRSSADFPQVQEMSQ